jgi:AbrB family looped-hinge helix DNA binding protein
MVRRTDKVRQTVKVRARVSSKGQITLPKAVRECLGIEQGSTIEIEVADGEAIIRPAESAFLRHMGTFKTTHPIDFDDWAAVREEVSSDVARRAAKRGRL